MPRLVAPGCQQMVQGRSRAMPMGKPMGKGMPAQAVPKSRRQKERKRVGGVGGGRRWPPRLYRCSRHLRPPTPPPPISSFFCLLSPAAAQVAAAVVHCDSRRGPLLVCSHSAEGTIRDADNLLVLSLLTAISGISRLALIISCALHQSRQSGSGAVNSIGCSSCAWAHRRAGHA
jgi:hypothetical protein